MGRADLQIGNGRRSSRWIAKGMLLGFGLLGGAGVVGDVGCAAAAPPANGAAFEGAPIDGVASGGRTAQADFGDPDRFDVVVLDAGHGGHDEGAIGPSGLREKELVLDVTRRLARKLVLSGLHVVLTRRDDRFLSLEERTAVANDARADLFLSIHANASTSRSPRGIETYFASLDSTDEDARRVAERENTALGASAPTVDTSDPVAAILGDLIETEHLQASNEFAKLAEDRLAAVDDERSRGVKQAPFVVLLGVRMPSTLVEIGFVTHPGEEKQLRASSRKDAIAEALARAIVEFGRRHDARRGIQAAREDRDAR